MLDGREYAIKRINLNPKNTQLNRKIVREVKLLSQLNHENVVRYYNSWIEVARLHETTGLTATDSSLPDATSDSLLLTTSNVPPAAAATSDGGASSAAVEWAVSSYSTYQCGAGRRGVSSKFAARPDGETSSDDDEEDVLGNSFWTNQEEDDDDGVVFERGEGDSQRRHSRLDTTEESATSSDDKPPPFAASSVEDAGGTTIQTLYIQMEFCENATLRQLINRRELLTDSRRAWRLFREILEGIKYIHSQGMIHRDIKPDNVFLDSQDHAKIGDFGLATRDLIVDWMEYAVPMDAVSSSGLTTAVGTSFYVSPELREPGKQGGKMKYSNLVDIYSCGVVLFEMFYRAPVGMERELVMTALCRTDDDDTRRLPADFYANFSDDTVWRLCALFKACLCHDPQHRLSAAKLLQENLLPPYDMLETEFQTAFRNSILHERSRDFRWILGQLFARTVGSALDYCYDQKALQQLSPSVARSAVQAELLRRMEAVFALYGCVRFDVGNFAAAASQSSANERDDTAPSSSSVVTMVDVNGLLVTAPYDLRYNFARYLARNPNVARLKRFTIGNVYRQVGAKDAVFALYGCVRFNVGNFAAAQSRANDRDDTTTPSSSVVTMVDVNGLLVTAPYDLRYNFARYLARNPNVARLKRFTIGNVYRQVGAKDAVFALYSYMRFDVGNFAAASQSRANERDDTTTPSSSSVVTMVDVNGLLVTAPYDLRYNFARYLARNPNVARLKRFTIGNVYRQVGAKDAVFALYSYMRFDVGNFAAASQSRANERDDTTTPSSSSVVTMVDVNGLLVTAPYDLRYNFARYLARNPNVARLKRFTIGNVYRQEKVAGNQPRALLECSADVVQERTAAATAAAELLAVVCDVHRCCVSALCQHQYAAVLKIGHLDLFRAICLHCGVPQENVGRVLCVFDETVPSEGDSTDNSSLKKKRLHKLVECGIRESVVGNLLNMLELEDSFHKITSDLRIIRKGKHSSPVAQNAFAELEKILDSLTNLTGWLGGADNSGGPVIKIVVSVGLTYRPDVYSTGFVFKFSVLKPTKKDRQIPRVVLIAAGGRYDALVDALRKPTMDGAGAAVACVGASLSMDALVKLCQACPAAVAETTPQRVLVCSVEGDGGERRTMVRQKLGLVRQLRAESIACDFVHEPVDHLDALQDSCRLGAVRHVLILSDAEPSVVRLRSLTEGDGYTERRVRWDAARRVPEYGDWTTALAYGRRRPSASFSGPAPSADELMSQTSSSSNKASSGVTSTAQTCATMANVNVNFIMPQGRDVKKLEHISRRYEAQMASVLTGVLAKLSPKITVELLATVSLPASVVSAVCARLDLHASADAEAFGRRADELLTAHARHKRELSILLDAVRDIVVEASEAELAKRLVVVYSLLDDAYAVIV